MEASLLQRYRDYLENEKCMTPRSVRDYIDFFNLVSSRLDVLKVESYKQVNDSIKAIKEERGYSQGSVYKLSICVRHLFRWIQREGFRPDNPYPFAEWRKPRPATPKFLTEATFLSIIDDPSLCLLETALLWLLWDSGARIGEIEQLRQDSFDLEKGLVNIPYEISKGNYSYRNVPISKTCIEYIRALIGHAQRRGHHQAVFFNASNEPMTRSGMQKLIKNIGMRKSPLRPVMRLSPHQFRHSFGIRHIDKVPQIVIQKWLGHSSLDMTSRYINMDAVSSRRIFEQHYPSEKIS